MSTSPKPRKTASKKTPEHPVPETPSESIASVELGQKSPNRILR